MTNNDFYWYWFTNIAGIGVKTQKKLLEHFGHPSTIYNAPESEIKGILTTGQCKEVIASKNQKKIEASIRKLEKREIYFFHRESQEYPERLAQLYEPPNLLYYIGRLPNFSKPILAIVGARRATIYGRKMAREFEFISTGVSDGRSSFGIQYGYFSSKRIVSYEKSDYQRAFRWDFCHGGGGEKWFINYC